MAWTFVGVGTSVESTTTAITLTEPAGVQEGDFLVACFSLRMTTTVSMTGPAGWLLAGSDMVASTATNTSAAASAFTYYMTRGAAAPSYAFTIVGPNVTLGRVIAYRGQSRGKSLNPNSGSSYGDQFAGGRTASNITACNVAAADGIKGPLSNGCLLVASCCGGQEATFNSFNSTNPTGASGSINTSPGGVAASWTKRCETVTTSGSDTSLAIFDAVQNTKGGTGNFTVTASLGAAHMIAVSIFNPVQDGTGWDPIIRFSYPITFSSDCRTASCTGTGQTRLARTYATQAGGKRYCEILVTAAPLYAGLSDVTAPDNSIENATYSTIRWTSSGGVFQAATSIGSAASYASGDRLCIAADITGGLYWFKKGAGLWNNNASADPATGVGGISAAKVGIDQCIYVTSPFTGGSGFDATLCANFANLVYAPPTGFTTWLGEVPSIPNAWSTNDKNTTATLSNNDKTIAATAGQVAQSRSTTRVESAPTTLINFIPGTFTIGSAIASDSSNQYRFQTFTTDYAVILSGIDIVLAKTASPTDNVTLDIYAADAGHRPTGSILASATPLAASAMVGDVVRHFVLPSPPRLSASTEYAVVLGRSGGYDNANYVQVRWVNVDAYAGGLAGAYNNGAWQAGAGADYPIAVIGVRDAKYYAEIVVGAPGSDGSTAFGVHDTTAVIGSALFQTSSKSFDYDQPGRIHLNGVLQVSTNSPLIPGDVVSVAFDAVNERGWIRKNNLDWNGTAGADPATNAGGYDTSSFTGQMAVAAKLWMSAANATIRTEKAEFTQTTPSGFLSWMGETLTVPDIGTLASGSAGVSGSGSATHYGTGTLNAQTATCPGFGKSESVGTGALTAVPVTRKNFLRRSQNIVQAGTYWSSSNSTTLSDNAIAPNGTLTAERFTDNAVDGPHYFYEDVNTDESPAQHTFSLHAKAGTLRWLCLHNNSGSGGLYAYFDLVGGVVGSKHASATSRMTAVGDGWHRCEVTSMYTSGGSAYIFAALADGGAFPTYVGSGGTYFLWGGQFERGAVATPYIPTGDAAVAVVDTLVGTGTVAWVASGALAAGVAAASGAGTAQSPPVTGTGVLTTANCSTTSFGVSQSFGSGVFVPQLAA